MRNKTINTLIVEDNKKACQIFVDLINANSDFLLVGATGSEEAAMEYLSTYEVDFMILDLELEVGDGIHLLEEINKKLRVKPYIIVSTHNTSEVIQKYIVELGVDFVYLKNNSLYTPQRILSMGQKMSKYLKGHQNIQRNEVDQIRKEAEENEKIKEDILEYLLVMGFQQKYSGTTYLKESIFWAYKFRGKDIQMSRDIYWNVKKVCQVAEASVEKNIRYVIERVWTDQDLEDLERHYPFDLKEEKKPSNKEFIVNLAEYFYDLFRTQNGKKEL